MRRAPAKTQMDAIQFGSFIAKRRKELGMTQKELAEKLTVTDKAVSRWENGHGFPDIETLEPLAHSLEVTLTELLHGEEKTQKSDTAIENALEITIENRKKERKITILLFAVAILLTILLSGVLFFVLGTSIQVTAP